MQSTQVLRQRAAEFFAINLVEVPYRLDTERLNAEHGEALRSLASILLADPAGADGAVSRLLSHAGEMLLEPNDKANRRRLSRHLYLDCTWANLVSGYFPDLSPWLQESTDDVVESVARLRENSEHQRAAIALYLYGDHTYRQVAELLALPEADVLGLLRSGLAELHLLGA